jgi:hypothetical protein
MRHIAACNRLRLRHGNGFCRAEDLCLDAGYRQRGGERAAGEEDPEQRGSAAARAPAADNPNFLIAMDLSGKTAYGGSTGVGVSVGIPVGRAGRVSVGGGKSTPVETKEGTLVLHFLDAKTKSLFWKATASGAVEPGLSPEEQQKRINDVIAQMLAQFPPKK